MKTKQSKQTKSKQKKYCQRDLKSDIEYGIEEFLDWDYESEEDESEISEVPDEDSVVSMTLEEAVEALREQNKWLTEDRKGLDYHIAELKRQKKSIGGSLKEAKQREEDLRRQNQWLFQVRERQEAEITESRRQAAAFERACVTARSHAAALEDRTITAELSLDEANRGWANAKRRRKLEEQRRRGAEHRIGVAERDLATERARCLSLEEALRLLQVDNEWVKAELEGKISESEEALGHLLEERLLVEDLRRQNRNLTADIQQRAARAQKAVAEAARAAAKAEVRICAIESQLKASEASGESYRTTLKFEMDRGTAKAEAAARAAAVAAEKRKYLEETCNCPITQVTMTDPVVASDGHTYERSAILRWFGQHAGAVNSPMTNQPMPNRYLMANLMAKQIIKGG